MIETQYRDKKKKVDYLNLLVFKFDTCEATYGLVSTNYELVSSFRKYQLRVSQIFPKISIEHSYNFNFEINFDPYSMQKVKFHRNLGFLLIFYFFFQFLL